MVVVIDSCVCGGWGVQVMFVESVNDGEDGGYLIAISVG